MADFILATVFTIITAIALFKNEEPSEEKGEKNMSFNSIRHDK